MRPWLSSFHLSPEARQAIRGPTFAYIECVLFWPFSKIFPDIYWDRYDPRDGYVRTKRVPKSLRKRRRGRRVSMEKLDVPSLSPLLGLPREIRDVIWEYVVGNMQVHWYTEDRRLTGNRCWSEETHCQQECLSWADRPIYPPLKSGIVKAISRPKFGVMGALMSCRQIYSETIDFLYSCNTFDTRDADVIAFLPRLLLPHRISKIQKLQILLSVSMPPSYPSLFDRPEVIPAKKLHKARKFDHSYRKLWDAMWNNLSEMEGLVTLMVELNMLGRHNHLWETNDFGCVRWVHGPREVRLILSDTVARRIAADVGVGNCIVESNIC